MVEVSFFPLDINYQTKEGKSYVYLYGKTVAGKQICVVEESKPYFYVTGSDIDVLKNKLSNLVVESRGKRFKVTGTEEVKRLFSNEQIKLIKVYTEVPAGKSVLRKYLAEKGIQCFEYDILYIFQYLRDKGITPMSLVKVEGKYAEEKSKVPVFYAEKMEQESSEMLSDLKILSFDIETYARERAIIPEKNPVLMVAFYGMDGEKPFKKVITWKRFKTKLNYLEFVDSEHGLIQKFKEIVEKYKPDILTGYYSDGFDLPYLEKRAEVYGIKLDLGRDYSELKIKKGDNTTGRITGLVHVDAFKFVRNVYGRGMKTDSFGLNAVAGELLGYGKHDINLDNLASIWDEKPEELEEFCKYNLHDAYTNYELLVKLLPSMLELVKLVGVPLFDLNRMSFSRLVENYILKRGKEFNMLAQNRPDYKETEWRRKQTYAGGFVYEPKPGLYNNLAVFDFRSLYPTIIAAHNVGPDSLGCGCCTETEKEPENKYWFCKKKKGFFPKIMEDLISRRSRVKEMIKVKRERHEDTALLDARSYGLKILANAFYGYMGFFAARWYCLECVQSITSYARNYIKKTMKKAESVGFEIVYGDTDSLMFLLGDKSREDALSFMHAVNDTLPEFMELEFEGFYPRALFVGLKGSKGGAKKKYALYDGTEVKVVGFEAVRRNWSKVAKVVQDKVLRIILQENDPEQALGYVKGVVEKIRLGEIGLDKLVIKTQITRSLEAYENVGPHVAVAKRMVLRGQEVVPGMVIEYVVGKGAGLIREKAKLLDEISDGEYDADYYIKNQIMPAVSSIFLVLGYEEEFFFKKKEQKSLGDF